MNSLITQPQLALRLGKAKRVIAVSSLEDAANKWNELRDRSGRGSSTCPKVEIVNVDTGETVARVSYNGRVWDLQDKEIRIGSRKLASEEDWSQYTARAVLAS